MVGVDVEEVAVFIDPLCQPHFPFVELSRRVEVWDLLGRKRGRSYIAVCGGSCLAGAGFLDHVGSIGVFFGHAIEWK